MDSTYSITGDASSEQHSWAPDQISQLVHQIRLDRHEQEGGLARIVH